MQRQICLPNFFLSMPRKKRVKSPKRHLLEKSIGGSGSIESAVLARKYGVVKSIPIRPNDIRTYIHTGSWKQQQSEIESSHQALPVVLIFDFVPSLDSRLASFPCSPLVQNGRVPPAPSIDDAQILSPWLSFRLSKDQLF